MKCTNVILAFDVNHARVIVKNNNETLHNCRMILYKNDTYVTNRLDLQFNRLRGIKGKFKFLWENNKPLLFTSDYLIDNLHVIFNKEVSELPDELVELGTILKLERR